MKTKIAIATLLGCLVWQQGAMSQTDTTATNPATTDQVAPAAQPSTGTDSNQATDTNAAGGLAAARSAVIAASTTTNIPSVAPTTNLADASVVTNADATTNLPPTATDDGTTNSNETATATGSQPSAPPSIPLIQFQDVPITTAIENLARQAGINYLIDPKIGYGQPDQNGQIKPEPTLSIRWENVTAAQALVALLDNYNLQLTEDRKTQIARITAKDPTAPPPISTRVIQLKYASTSNMLASVQASLTDKRSKVMPDARTSQIIVVATESEQEEVDTLINQLDKPTRQVLIETKLVQVSSNPTTKKGVDWSGTLAAQNLAFGNGLIQPSSATTATIPGTSTGFAGHPGTSSSGSSQ